MTDAEKRELELLRFKNRQGTILSHEQRRLFFLEKKEKMQKNHEQEFPS